WCGDVVRVPLALRVGSLFLLGVVRRAIRGARGGPRGRAAPPVGRRGRGALVVAEASPSPAPAQRWCWRRTSSWSGTPRTANGGGPSRLRRKATPWWRNQRPTWPGPVKLSPLQCPCGPGRWAGPQGRGGAFVGEPLDGL